MSCEKPTPCPPCADPCGPAPAPVLPRCDIVLPDGVYLNATVVVENGCITVVAQGEAPLYDPDVCCATPGGGGGGGGGAGPQGPPGVPGAPASVQVGSVATTAPGTTATVVNTGTAQNAIFNFTIPRGAPGTDGSAPTGMTNTSADIVFTNGVLQGLPVQWPPIMLATAASATTGVLFTAVKNDANGMVTLTLSLETYDSLLRDWVTSQLGGLQSQIDALATQIATCCP